MTEYIVSLEPSEYDETLAHRSYPVKMRKGGTWERSSVSCTYCTDELTEIVRCRDCEYGRAVEEIGCIRFEAIGGDPKDRDGFCAWGKWRES